ncbi:hypothetical protein ABT263_25305 [Kitasatospora sp. NPDC001603]|uniref:ATP-dependent DNA ligase n=1 Tax=Kitasatospora sp. NPDC001603 TaxID=3154388 RepID=UPI00332BABE2
MAFPVSLPLPLAEASPIDVLPADVTGLAMEVKLDGWRLALDTERGQAFGRRGTNLTSRFADIAAAARPLGPAILDGELIALNPTTGTIDFTAIQRRSPRGPRPGEDFMIAFADFDPLALGTSDLRSRPYHERRAELERLLQSAPAAITAVLTTQDLQSALAWLPAPGVECLVLKRKDSPYRPGKTAAGWLKWRERHPIDLIVVGVTAATPARQALVLAQPSPAPPAGCAPSPSLCPSRPRCAQRSRRCSTRREMCATCRRRLSARPGAGTGVATYRWCPKSSWRSRQTRRRRSSVGTVTTCARAESATT